MNVKFDLTALVSAALLCLGGVESILQPSEKGVLLDAPFIVFIESRVMFCGGVILSENVVLTAAHCINAEPSGVSISAGTLNYMNTMQKQVSYGKKLLKHKSFALGTSNIQAFYDVGLILLDKPFKLNRYVNPIQLIDHQSIDFNKTATFYGYGYTDLYQRSGSSRLMKANISLIRHNECQTLLDQAITKNLKQEYEICGTAGPCGGDSGGPLVQQIDGVSKLVGILSWGSDDNISCGTAPSVFENVSYFSDWIRKGTEELIKE